MPPPPPPARSKGKGAIIALIAAGAVVVVLMSVAVVVLLLSSGPTPAEKLTTASQKLSGARTIKLNGYYPYGADTLRGQMIVTKGGRAAGEVTWGTEKVTLMSADNRIFVYAPRTYWEGELRSSNAARLLQDGDQWGMVEEGSRAGRLTKDITPTAIAAAMATTSKADGLTEVEGQIRGRPVVKIEHGGSTFFLTTGDDPHLLRYMSASPRISVDLTARTNAESTNDIKTMSTEVGRLGGAISTAVQTRNADKPEFVDCSKGGEPCKVKVEVTGTGLQSGQTVSVRVNFLLTSESGASGTEYGQCDDSGTLTLTQNAVAECTISGGEWAKSGKKATKVWVSAVSVPLAVSSGQIAAMRRGLEAE